MSTQIVEDIDAELKSAGVTEITSDLVTAQGKLPETQVSQLEETVEPVVAVGKSIFLFYNSCVEIKQVFHF